MLLRRTLWRRRALPRRLPSDAPSSPASRHVLATSQIALSAWGSRPHVRGFANATTVADLLAVSKEFRSKTTNYILEDQTLEEAVKYLAKNENSATLVVVNAEHKVVGLVTNHLLLAHIAKIKSSISATGTVDETAEWNVKVKDIAIPAREILHVSLEDSLEDCRAVMSLSGRGEIPVLEGGKLRGTVSLIDIASLLHRRDEQDSPSPTSAKSDYINVILPRKGLPSNTAIEDNSQQDKKHPGETWTYYLHSFAMSIPHPGKKEKGGEDAYFMGTLDHGIEEFDDKTGRFKEHFGPVDVLSMGVSDGVGSWFEKGISAKLYAQELMKAAHKAVQISYAKEQHIDPAEVLHAAWSTVLQKEIVGSATACVLTLDPLAAEIHAVNLGDSGFLIIRDKKSDLESARQRGTLDGSLSRRIRDRDMDLTPAGRRKGAHVSYRSPQQLHYFNCPFQLGFVGSEIHGDVTKDLAHAASSMTEKPLFETPENGVRLRVPVLEGDLILLATDGLFDNVDEEVLLDIVSDEPEVEAMTRKLVQKAYDLSLDRTKDSPFARLAKENDLMWGGGMPDDITIIAARVEKRKIKDAPAIVTATFEQPRKAAVVGRV
ncbi:hypothetical protein Poli38472_013714 [Pythium oligandrum]|uniref:Protein phosphatase n=1 Tax=Pythium oligandrum TaxID=41045 RepID=A0A8K1CD81_PYTOL|nr:hypothetical protein Poli38472_013714 [Pythium oligandrum]|eukprot:TMW61251.1 hypothetical protein Poli38472_013714 [Pythium oligandrum]